MHSVIIMPHIGVNFKLPVYCADTVFIVLSLFSHVVLERLYIFHELIDIYVVNGEQISASGTVLTDDLHARL